MVRLLLLFSACIVSLTGWSQQDTKTVALPGKNFYISLPALMDTMPADKILVKYNKQPGGKSAYYANPDFSFSVVMDEVAAAVTADMLEPLKPQLLAPLGKQQFSENKLITVNGHKLIVVAYNSVVTGGTIFNRRIFFVAGDKLFSIAYNSTTADLQKRKTQIESSIRSLQIK